jgi:hypothetical protein
MKNILLVVLAFLSLTVSAQKLLKPEVDRITGDTTWSTSKNKIYLNGNYLAQQGEAVECFVSKTVKAIVLTLIPQTLNENSSFTINEGQKAYLKLKDNSLVTLTCQFNLNSQTRRSNVDGTRYSNGILKVPYLISAENIAKIMSADLIFLRIETSNGNFDCDIKSKFAQVIKKQVELITNLR